MRGDRVGEDGGGRCAKSRSPIPTAGALATLSAVAGRPIGFGLLTCDTMEQARARVDKGAEAAEAAVEMANLSRKLARR